MMGAREAANRDLLNSTARDHEVARHRRVKAATEVPDAARHELQDAPSSAPEAARPLHGRASGFHNVATGSRQEYLLHGMKNMAINNS